MSESEVCGQRNGLEYCIVTGMKKSNQILLWLHLA